jgi:hypothetical protein
MKEPALPRGILPVLQTPFTEAGDLDYESLQRLIEDLKWNGSGLTLDCLHEIERAVPTLAGVKVETIPAGPKYSQVRADFGERLHISGGWAVPQFIEALDRGVDAMIPEAPMARVYTRSPGCMPPGTAPKPLPCFAASCPSLPSRIRRFASPSRSSRPCWCAAASSRASPCVGRASPGTHGTGASPRN